MSAAPILCMWDGKAFVPCTRFQLGLASKAFGEGEIVAVEAELERDWIKHKSRFARIGELWQTLPESMAEKPYAKTADALRKHALIATGHCNIEAIACGSKAAAERVAAYVGGLARQAHGYAIVEIDGPVVRVLTPHSQSKREMGNALFLESMRDVIRWIEDLIGVESAAWPKENPPHSEWPPNEGRR